MASAAADEIPTPNVELEVTAVPANSTTTDLETLGHAVRWVMKEESLFTGKVGYPVGMTVTGEYDRVVDLVSFDVVEYARPGGTVAVPGVLTIIDNLRKGENGMCMGPGF
jgi:hypothetical protein